MISQSTNWELSLISAIFGLVSLIAFYFLIKRNFNEKIALLSSIPLIFFPHLWLIQTNVLHESLDQGLFLLSLLFFDFFLTKKKFPWFLSSLLFLSLAIFNFVGLLLWAPVFIGLTILRSKKINWRNIVWGFWLIILSFGLALGGLFYLNAPLKVLLFNYGGGGIFAGWSFLDILRILRNDVLILFHGYSLAAILGLIFGGYFLFKKKNWPLIIFLLSFFIPFLITGKFWYGGLFGRYSSLVAYPLALLLATVPWRKIYGFLIVILFLSFLPTFWVYQKTPVSQIEAGLIDQISLKKEDLLILSDYQRPQLTDENALYLGGDQKQQKVIEEKIKEKLNKGEKVFISQQAMTFPYWQYDGQQIHIISKGDQNKAQLKEFLSDKKLTPVVDNPQYPLLTIYQLSL
ncbi:hypothetical protein FJZ41_03700 [Candidatus Shapirobacteria bacterium]|nr:hypothetical protein [Candidatus Shapirobacteria bacterium]